ncbi:hypothetical protein [Streptomyces sp. NPDC054838]
MLLAEGDAAGAAASFAEAVRARTGIGAPYETAECRLRLADALRAPGNIRAEALEREAARAELERIARACAAADSPRDTTESNTFVREGDYRRAVFEGRRKTVRDSKGMHRLARLLAAPGRELHVLDLGAADSDDPAPSWTAGPRRCTADGSPRSRTTSRRPVPPTTSAGRNRPSSNALS